MLAIEPENRRAVDALVELFSRTASWEELVALYLELAENTLEPEEQKALYFKVCQLLEDIVDDAERAVDTYRRILAIEPDNQQAFKALERFFRGDERWPELADLLLSRVVGRFGRLESEASTAEPEPEPPASPIPTS